MDITIEDRATLCAMRAFIDRLLAETDAGSAAANPLDPRNKIAGDSKLTARGAEVFYRMLDTGMSAYAAGKAMRISPRAAYLRFDTWKDLGGTKRQRLELLD